MSRSLSLMTIVLFAFSCGGNPSSEDGENSDGDSPDRQNKSSLALVSIGHVFHQFHHGWLNEENQQEIVDRLFEIVDGLGHNDNADPCITESLKYMFWTFGRKGWTASRFELEPKMDAQLSALQEKLEVVVQDDKEAQDNLDALICVLANIRNGRV